MAFDYFGLLNAFKSLLSVHLLIIGSITLVRASPSLFPLFFFFSSNRVIFNLLTLSLKILTFTQVSVVD